MSARCDADSGVPAVCAEWEPDDVIGRALLVLPPASFVAGRFDRARARGDFKLTTVTPSGVPLGGSCTSS
jgi:hypothetical protein